ncbi:MAG: hypothetical protein C0605_07855 [Hyphomicrobiales bacterium]|nr:MAG: hypothetical protein C0605_07855 [Hyphomicrobiales bacterium]
MNDEQNIPAATTFGQFLQMLEDGELHEDLSNKLLQINETLNQHFQDYGGKPKAQLDLSIKFSLERGAFTIEPSFKTKLPEAPRGKTVAWSTKDHRFTPANPAQLNMFGVREVGGGTSEVKQL